MINRMARGLTVLIGATALTLGMTAGAASASENPLVQSAQITAPASRTRLRSDPDPTTSRTGPTTSPGPGPDYQSDPDPDQTRLVRPDPTYQSRRTDFAGPDPTTSPDPD